jgi:hypothetical protein
VARAIAARAGLSQADAERRVGALSEQLKTSADNVRAATETARKGGMIALLTLGLVCSFAPRLALAHESHLAQAISHTREAVSAGREGKPSSLVLHATEALHHASAAQAERPNAQVKEAIARLKEAIIW